MIRMIHTIQVGVVGFCCLTAGAGATTLEAAVAELEAAQGKLTSYKATIKTVENLDFGDGNTLESEVHGTVTWMRLGGKLLYRSVSRSTSIQKIKGVETSTEAQQTMISDGAYFYTVATVDGEVRAAKQPISPMLVAGAKQILDNLRAEHHVRLQEERMIDGASCHVIEVRPKNPDENPHMVRTVMYFRKDTGTVVKTLGYGKSGVVYQTEHREIDLNPTLDRALFKFEPPKGVKVEDYTN